MDKQIKVVMAIEKKVEKISMDADKKAEKMIDDARKKAIDVRTDFEQSLKEKQDKEIKAAERKILASKEKIIAQGESENKKLKDKAQKNTTKAVDYVIQLLKKVN